MGTQCYRQSVDRNNECPVCHAALNKLAATLPFAHCSQSRLICHITGKPLDENNRPMMLPNGFVYGYGALAKMAQEMTVKLFALELRKSIPLQKLKKFLSCKKI